MTASGDTGGSVDSPVARHVNPRCTAVTEGACVTARAEGTEVVLSDISDRMRENDVSFCCTCRPPYRHGRHAVESGEWKGTSLYGGKHTEIGNFTAEMHVQATKMFEKPTKGQ